MVIYMTAEQYGHAYERGFHIGVRFFVSQGAPYDEAVEFVQAAWARGWERRDQLRDPNLVVPWIISIGRNLRSVRLKRLAKFSAELSGPLGQDDPSIAGIELKSILERCSPESRALLEAYYLQGLTIAEIAESDNASRGAVRARLARARQSARRRNALTQGNSSQSAICNES